MSTLGLHWHQPAQPAPQKVIQYLFNTSKIILEKSLSNTENVGVSFLKLFRVFLKIEVLGLYTKKWVSSWQPHSGMLCLSSLVLPPLSFPIILSLCSILVSMLPSISPRFSFYCMGFITFAIGHLC